MTGEPSHPDIAHEMAAHQRDISVSEFFLKNRHLLGFDSPSKAALTTVKEAVDNALDACEEAGILPEIRVEVSSEGDDVLRVSVEDNGPGIVEEQLGRIFGKLLVRLEIPQAQPVARPAGNGDRGGGDVCPAHDRETPARAEPRAGRTHGDGTLRVDQYGEEPARDSQEEASPLGSPARHARRSPDRRALSQGQPFHRHVPAGRRPSPILM